MSNRFRRLIILWFAILLMPPASAQNPCVPPVLARSHQDNIITGPLEVQFGELVAQQVGRQLRVIEDDAVTGYLYRIGKGLEEHMPPSEAPFRFYVYDGASLNAFSLPGARIYISRKLIASVRSEDELAGVLAHEMGHELAGHAGIDLTFRLNKVLKVISLKDAADLTEKYHLLLDNYMRDPGAWKERPSEADQEQYAADQVAIYAAALSGYSPKAYADFWDRTTELKGRTGDWLSDFFRTTRPGARRLREILKNITTLPSSCADVSRRPSAEEFKKWQDSVVSYVGIGRKEQVHNVLVRTVLAPPLRDQLQYVRVSPDGRYVLAQDAATIYVLTREPFVPLFHFSAHDARAAQFTPDSKGIVFYDRNLRVEKWNIERQHLDDADEVHTREECLVTELSPDGKYLGCLHLTEEGLGGINLSLFDASTSQVVYVKKGFITGSFSLYFSLALDRLFNLEPRIGLMRFSPDGRYMVAGTASSQLAIDLSTLKEVQLPSSVKDLLHHSFTFLSGNRLIGIAGNRGEKSAVVQFPGGEVLIPALPLGGSTFAMGGYGDYVIIENLTGAAAGIYDAKTKRFPIVSRVPGLAVYDRVFINERRDGELGLYNLSDRKELATVSLPGGAVGTPRTAAASADLQWLALSLSERGAVWDMARNERIMHLRAFNGISFGNGSLVATFPPERFPAFQPGQSSPSPEEREKHGQQIVRLDLHTRAADLLKEYPRDTYVRQVGSYLLLLTRDAKKQSSLLEVLNGASMATLWSRELELFPTLHTTDEHSESLVLLRRLDDRLAQRELKSDADLKKAASGIKKPESSYLIEIIEARTGKTLAKFPVETNKGSFRLIDAVPAGERVIFTDNENRVLLYSLAGERKGQMFGGRPIASADNSLLCVEHEPGRLTVYDLRSLQKLDQFTFATRVLYAAFSSDSKRLLVVTDDQIVFVLGISAGKGSTVAN